MRSAVLLGIPNERISSTLASLTLSSDLKCFKSLVRVAGPTPSISCS